MHSDVVAARLKDTDDDVCYEAWLMSVGDSHSYIPTKKKGPSNEISE